MNIPGKFKVAGQEVVVKPFQHSYQNGKPMGLTMFDRNAIAVLVDTDIPASVLEQTFFHEMVHYVLATMGDDKLSNNEKFVEGFSQLLYQAITTMEGHVSDNFKCDYSTLDPITGSVASGNVQSPSTTVSERGTANPFGTKPHRKY